MTPIGVDRVRQVEPQERRIWDDRVRGLLAPLRLAERARSPGGVWYLCPVVRRAMVVSKVFGADWLHLPMEGRGQKFPAICLFRQGLAFHWAVEPFCMSILFAGKKSRV
jgi:hypothetical protein